MQVSKEHRKILLNLREPERVTALIPKSRAVNVKGQMIVAVQHDLDEVRVLRNIGVNAPSPVRYYYDWPGLYKPFTHQLETTEFMTLNPRAFVLNDMGTGKSISALWAFDYLRSIGKVKRMLIISPLSTLERTWGDEIFKHFRHLEFTVLHGTAQQRKDRLAMDKDIYIINHDGIKSKELLNLLTQRDRLDAVLVDEISGGFRNSSSDRWKCLRTLTKDKAYVWGLTGTPIPKAPTDAWAQVKIVRPDSTAARYFGAFRDQVMRQVTQFKWVAKEDSLDTVHRIMQPAIRFKREDCIDLPPTTYLDRHAELGAEQGKMYKSMLDKFEAECDAGQVTAVNEAVKVNKLLQIVSGVAYGDDGDITLPSPARVQVVKDTIEEADGKVIVFVPFTGALTALAAELGEDYTVEIIHGGVSKNERDRIFGEFQNGNNPKVLVANASAMSHGITLTAADTIIWYSPVHSAETYEQANARIVRPGQKRNTRIVRIEGTDLERRMYDKLQNRVSTQGTLLGMFEKEK